MVPLVIDCPETITLVCMDDFRYCAVQILALHLFQHFEPIWGPFIILSNLDASLTLEH